MFEPSTPTAAPSSISTITIGLGTLGLNLLVFIVSVILNFYVYRKRLIEERKYKSETDFFNTIVIKHINDIIAYPNNVEKQCIKIKKEWVNAHQKGLNVRSVIENGLDQIEQTYEDFLRDTLSICHCYSLEMKDELENLASNYHDSITRKLSQLTKVGVSDKYSNILLNLLGNTKSQYLRELNVLIRKHRPKIEKEKKKEPKTKEPNKN